MKNDGKIGWHGCGRRLIIFPPFQEMVATQVLRPLWRLRRTER